MNYLKELHYTSVLRLAEIMGWKITDFGKTAILNIKDDFRGIYLGEVFKGESLEEGSANYHVDLIHTIAQHYQTWPFLVTKTLYMVQKNPNVSKETLLLVWRISPFDGVDGEPNEIV